MKQKEKWAQDATDASATGDSAEDASFYVGWLAGFEFAKQKASEMEDVKEGYLDESILDLGEEDV